MIFSGMSLLTAGQASAHPARLSAWSKEFAVPRLDSKSQRAQFESLTLALAPRLFRLALTRLGSVQDAEDAVQDTYLKAYRAFASFRPGTNIQAWLTQILINSIRDQLRKAGRQPPTISEDSLPEGCSIEEMLADHRDPAQIFEDSQIDPILVRAIRSLPEIWLTPWLLRELQDLSYKEIASVLDIPIGTVMSRLSRARAALRELIAGQAASLPAAGAIKASQSAEPSEGGMADEM